MRLLTASECNAIDEYAINTLQIPQSVLMERAATDVANTILTIAKPSDKILILSGGGNNGGDGIALARILKKSGFEADVVLLKDIESCKDSIRHQAELLKEAEGTYLTAIPDTKYDIIVDAILGVGLTKAPRENLAHAIAYINQKGENGAQVISIDIPSGVNTDTGETPGEAVKADVTVTFTAMKPGLICHPGRELSGRVVVSSIGVEDVVSRLYPDEKTRFCYESDTVKLKKRPADGNKGSFHRVGIIAGSKAMSGACILSAEAALRAGAGLADVYTHEANRVVLATAVPEAILHTYGDETDFIGSFLDDLKKDDVIVLGPGLSVDPVAKAIVSGILKSEIQKPLILDADALNIISADEEIKKIFVQYSARNEVVITPHPKEFSRMSGLSVSELLADYEKSVRTFAKEWNVILVGKGNPTIVSNSEQTYYNLSGNDGMATAGSGDVLSGCIGAFLLNEENAFDGVCKAVYAHGLSGDYQLKNYGHRGMIARDLIEGIKKLEEN